MSVPYFLAASFAGLITIAVIAVVSRRLLGLQVGIARTMTAGVVAYGASAIFANAYDEPDQRAVFITVQIGLSVLVAMGFLAVAEVLVPRSLGVSALAWRRSLQGRWARTRRYSQISAIAFRRGLRPYLRGRRSPGADSPNDRASLARSLRLALEEGGVTFVKLGQLLSTRRDLLPIEFVDELTELQHQGEPVP